MTETLGILGFLAIFHIIGGIAIGSAVRNLVRGKLTCRTPFMVVWGLIFGGAPLIIGFTQLASHGALLFSLAEIGIFLATIVITALVPDWYLEALNVPTVTSIGFGGLFLVVGIGLGVFLAMQNEPLMAIIFFGAFAGAGGLVFINALHTLLSEK